MAIQQLSDGRWRVDVEPVKGKRFRKTLKTKAEAMRFEAMRYAHLAPEHLHDAIRLGPLAGIALPLADQ